MANDKLARGWTFDSQLGSICHFQYFPLSEADELIEDREAHWVLETIYGTPGNGNPDECHLNEFFAGNLGDAIALAARIEISSKE